MQKMGLQARRHHKTHITTNSKHAFRRYPNLLINLIVDKPDLVWGADITYNRLQCEFVYIQINMADVGAAWQNGFAERLICTIKEEEVYLSECRNYWDAYHRIEYFLEEVYMRK